MKYSFLFAFLLCWSLTNAQTTTYEIDYSYDVGLGTSCNVFSTEKTISGYKHQTTKGFPNYVVNSQIGSHINLACKRNSSSSQSGTDYQILFPFKKDYKYQINVYYKSTYASGEFAPMIGVRMNTTNKAHNTSVSCSGPQSIDFMEYQGQGSAGLGFAWPSAPLISTAALTQDYESLSIASFPLSAYQATQVQGIQVRTVRIVEIAPPPPVTPPVNDEYAGAITLTPSSSSSCTQQVAGNFSNATNSQLDPGNDSLAYFSGYAYRMADLWYKFTPTNNSQSIGITPSLPSSDYFYFIEIYSSENELRLVDFKMIRKNEPEGNELNISGLETGKDYYARVSLGGRTYLNQSKNINFSICIKNPVISSTSTKINIWGAYGSTLNLSYLLPQSIPESDLSFDWKIERQFPDNGYFLYTEGSNPVYGITMLENVQGRRVKLYAPIPVIGCYIMIRIKQLSTNTYLTDWIENEYGFDL